MSDSLILTCRNSQLAQIQAAIVRQRLNAIEPNCNVKIVAQASDADLLPQARLRELDGKAMFTHKIDTAVLTGAADCAVHSLKDLDSNQPPAGMEIAAWLSPAPANEAIVSAVGYTCPTDLPKRAKVATISLRRKAQLLSQRPDLQVVELRGNVVTRINRLLTGEFDALMLAAAGLYRLQQNNCLPAGVYYHSLPLLPWLPAAGQGVIVTTATTTNANALQLLQTISDHETEISKRLERSFLALLQLDCWAPIAVHARLAQSDGNIDSRSADNTSQTDRKIDFTARLYHPMGEILEQIDCQIPYSSAPGESFLEQIVPRFQAVKHLIANPQPNDANNNYSV